MGKKILPIVTNDSSVSGVRLTRNSERKRLNYFRESILRFLLQFVKNYLN